jgi:hypothetical protein
MAHRITLTVSALALAAGAGTIAASPASADQYAGPNGAISASCAGTKIATGRLYDSRGQAHPTARWRLYSSTADGGTKCLQVWDGTRGRHAMAAMIRPAGDFHDGAKTAATFDSRTSAVSVKKAGKRCIGFTAELTDGRFYQRNVNEYGCS